MTVQTKPDGAALGESKASTRQSGDATRTDGAAVVAAETQPPIVDTSWDPYQVWLTRVKQPRELSARRQSRPAIAQPVKATDLSETARLRTLTITR